VPEGSVASGPAFAQAARSVGYTRAYWGIPQNRRRKLWPSEGAQSFGTAPDPLVTLSGSCGQLSDRRQASEESLPAMAARSEWFGATASKDSSLELAPLCCLAVTAAQNDSHGAGGQQSGLRFWDTPPN